MEQREISPDPGQLWGLSWSGGLTPVGARGPRSLCHLCLSFSVQLDMWEPHNPPPSLRLPDPGQFCQAMRGHLWEFIPDASCSLNPLLFLHLSSLSLYHTRPPSNPASTCLYCLSHKPSLLFSHAHAKISFSLTFYKLSVVFFYCKPQLILLKVLKLIVQINRTANTKKNPTFCIPFLALHSYKTLTAS